jgi:hypothetical protein
VLAVQGIKQKGDYEMPNEGVNLAQPAQQGCFHSSKIDMRVK